MIDDESTVLVVERKMDPSHLRRCSMIADFDMRCPVVCCAVVVEVAEFWGFFYGVVLESDLEIELISDPGVKVWVTSLVLVVKNGGNAGQLYQTLGHFLRKWVLTLFPR